MKQRKISAVLLAIIIIISAFTACSTQTIPADNQQTTEATTVPATVAVEDEIIKFNVTDKDGNILVLVPLFDKDNETIIGGYVLSASDSNGNALDKSSYPNLGSFVNAKKNDDASFSLVYDENGNIIIFDVYADSDGNMVAFKDTYDIDANGNKEEFFGISTLTNSNGITFYSLTADEASGGYKILEVEKDEDGLLFVRLGDGTTLAISKVNANNDAANKKISEQTSSNEQRQGSSSSAGDTQGNGNVSGDSNGTDSGNNTNGGSDVEETPTDTAVRITLDKNAGATIKNDKNKLVSISRGVLTIKGTGDFVIDQSTNEWHGQIVVKMAAEDKAEIRFENVKIINEQVNTVLFIDNTDMSVNDSDTEEIEGSMPEGPTQDQIKDLSKNYDGVSPNLDLSFPTGTESTFCASGRDVKGVIYNESKLTIKGNGICNVEHKNNSNCAINSVKSIKLKNATLNLKTPTNMEGARGIYSISTVTVESGKLNIISGGDCIRCDDFAMDGGTVSLNSDSADGVDASDSIIINGGDLTVVATSKSSLKVRAINLLEDGLKSALKEKETFEINGGTIKAMGYKVSTVLSTSTQASISADTNTKNNYQFTLYYKNPDDSNTIIYETPVETRRFLYSSSSIDSSKTGRSFNGGNSKVECYKVKAGGNNKVVSFFRTVGSAEIKLA